MSPKNNVNIRNPEVSGDQEPMLVFWGKFFGDKEKIGGAFFVEIPPGASNFRNFNLALFDNKSEISKFNPSESALIYKDAVKKWEGANNSLKQSDLDLCREVFKDFILNRRNLAEFKTNVTKSNSRELADFFDRLISNFIRKGRLNVEVTCQLISENALEKGMKEAMNAPTAERKQQKKSVKKNNDVHYHKVSIVTIPLKGVRPGKLNPGDEIFIRAMGSIASKFPEELQSEKYENTTVPIEARVEAVKSNPVLPPDYDGNPEDYIEVSVIFGKNNHGRGYVYKDETVKTVTAPEKPGPDTSLIARILVACGFGLASLSAIAWLIFG